eukprot:1873062-Alexandrium_andersonii.AAC.1
MAGSCSLGCALCRPQNKFYEQNPVVDYALARYGRGDLSAIGVRGLARALCLQGPQAPPIAKLASLGGFGVHGSNVGHDLQ